MRRNERLSFTKRDDRPLLSLNDVRYWKRLLESASKLGFEHEFNLKENTGRCDGSSMICPCNHPEKESRECYAECKVYKSCKLRNKYECPGIYCLEFVSPCPSCPEATKDCSRCELFNDPKINPQSSRKAISKALSPTEDLGRVGKAGVLEVVTDGSLLGGTGDDKGVEVTTVGRRVIYESLFEQTKEIMDRAVDHGAYLNERCSTHVHLVAGYFTLVYQNGEVKVHYKKGHATDSNFTELERPMPEIILANFHQLIRRYHNAITWISSAGTSYEHITRWMKFRKPILQFSAVRRPMRKIIQEINKSDQHHGSKYAAINYSPIKFNTDGSIKVFHIESRFSDGMLSPSASTAMGILLYALLMKAVSLSQFGIVHSGDSSYMKEARIIQACLLNNDGSYGGSRHGQTQGFEPYREKVREQARSMIHVLRTELQKYGPVTGILKKLADMPCSMRLCNGDDWDRIEADLSGTAKTNSKVATSVLSFIDMSYVDDCIDVSEWISTVSEDLKVVDGQIEEAVKDLTEDNIVAWDGLMGTLVRC